MDTAGGTRGERRRRPLRDELTDLPNLLTLGRIAILPAVLALIDNYSRVASFFAAVLFLVGALTDLLDGYLARRRGQVSVLGAFLDPFADKLYVLGTLVFLVARDRAPEWLVVVLLARELGVTFLRALASQYGLVVPAGPGGKTKTALQVVGIVFLLVHFPYRLLLVGATVHFRQVGLMLLYLSLAMSLWSAGQYVRLFVQAVEERDRRSGRDRGTE